MTNFCAAERITRFTQWVHTVWTGSMHSTTAITCSSSGILAATAWKKIIYPPVTLNSHYEPKTSEIAIQPSDGQAQWWVGVETVSKSHSATKRDVIVVHTSYAEMMRYIMARFASLQVEAARRLTGAARYSVINIVCVPARMLQVTAWLVTTGIIRLTLTYVATWARCVASRRVVRATSYSNSHLLVLSCRIHSSLHSGPLHSSVVRSSNS